MQIGLTAERYGKISLPFVLRLFHYVGVPFSELTANSFDQPEKMLKIGRGMTFGLHLPNVGNTGYDFSSIRQKEKIEFVLRQLDAYRKRFRFQYALFHPPQDEPSQTSLDFLIGNLQRVNVPLIVENVVEYDLDAFQKFYNEMKKHLGNKLQGICLDIPHAHLAGLDWREFYSVFKEKVIVVHLSSCARGLDCHLPFDGSGDLVLDDILSLLKDFEFNGILNFEIQPQSLAALDVYFDTLFRAFDFFGISYSGKMKRRAKMVDFVGRVLNRVL